MDWELFGLIGLSLYAGFVLFCIDQIGYLRHEKFAAIVFFSLWALPQCCSDSRTCSGSTSLTLTSSHLPTSSNTSYVFPSVYPFADVSSGWQRAWPFYFWAAVRSAFGGRVLESGRSSSANRK